MATLKQTNIDGSLDVIGTTSTHKTRAVPIIGLSTWSSGGNLTTARSALAGAGTQTAGLAFGGRVPASYQCHGRI